jgi:rhodanese-related sulfurtransferase
MKLDSFILLIMFSLFSCVMFSQNKGSQEKGVRELLSAYNKMSVPYISVQTLRMDYEDYVILDTRKKEEYDVSHLPGAIWAGEKFDLTKLPELKRDSKIVVYCTVGIRSEGYGEKMQKEGFINVQNLYGSIFYWKDAGYEVLDLNEEPTEKVHVFGKIWSKYLKTGEKVY